jgi:hypothetical protein
VASAAAARQQGGSEPGRQGRAAAADPRQRPASDTGVSEVERQQVGQDEGTLGGSRGQWHGSGCDADTATIIAAEAASVPAADHRPDNSHPPSLRLAGSGSHQEHQTSSDIRHQCLRRLWARSPEGQQRPSAIYAVEASLIASNVVAPPQWTRQASQYLMLSGGGPIRMAPQPALAGDVTPGRPLQRSGR